MVYSICRRLPGHFIPPKNGTKGHALGLVGSRVMVAKKHVQSKLLNFVSDRGRVKVYGDAEASDLFRSNVGEKINGSGHAVTVVISNLGKRPWPEAALLHSVGC